MLAAQIPVYRCSGKWNKINDTIILNSKFKSKDFSSVKESYTAASPNDLIILIFSGMNGYFSGDIRVNDKDVGRCQYKDTIYYKCRDIKSLRLLLAWPGSS